MAQNFIACDREQELLLPPSLREWLPGDHLAWLVLDAVAEMDLGAFYASYRDDGWGRAAHDPAMMVALLVPDHATIARFRVRHEAAIAGLSGEVLALCVRSGLVKVGVVAVEGRKIAAAATRHATRSYAQIAQEILEDAARTDAAEDELFGDARGDDPDSRNLKTTRGWVQGYNAQAVVGEGQIVLAAEISIESLDSANLEPMVKTAIRELEAVGVSDPPAVVLADAGYWKNDAIEALCGEGIPTLVAPDADRRKQPRPGRRGGLYDFARGVLATDWGKQLYLKRQGIVEPVFGQIKSNRGANRFHRRGRSAVRSEWRLLTATHNLLKLHQHQLTAT